MKQLFDNVCIKTSKMVTNSYSTSFSLGIKFLHKEFQDPIYSIYGFVRFADEIVDTFHDFNKRELLEEFKIETFRSIERGISLNPILNSFQQVVNKYNIDHHLVDAFFKSMESDLNKYNYDTEGYKEYIYGSAEVVGLMCLFVFCDGNKEMYLKLKPYAMALGSAFQKVNFLRDIKADSENLKRVYFPGVDFKNFTSEMKASIEKDIEADFKIAYEGVLLLPEDSRFGVYVAYKYYLSLFKKIKIIQAATLLNERIRIPNYSKALIIMRAGLRSRLNIL